MTNSFTQAAIAGNDWVANHIQFRKNCEDCIQEAVTLWLQHPSKENRQLLDSNMKVFEDYINRK